MGGGRGAVIHEVTKIERSEETPFIFEDADFSVTTIRKLISQGSDDAEDAIVASKSKQ